MDIILWLLFVAVVVSVSFAVSVKVVPAHHVGIVERLGKYHATLPQGLHFVIPFVDRIRAQLDVHEQPFSRLREPLITQGGSVVLTDAVVHFTISDPRAAFYEVDDYMRVMNELTLSTLRDRVGAMDLGAALASRVVLADEVRRALS